MEGNILFRIIDGLSFGLAGFTIAAVLVLFVRRFIIMAIERRNASRRAELQAQVYSYLEQPEENAAALTKLSLQDQRLLLSLVSEMVRGVSGQMRAQLKALLGQAIDIDRMILTLRKGLTVDRAKTAARLFWCDLPIVREALVGALDDPEPTVVLAAINALIAIGHPLNLLMLVPKLEARDMLGHRAVRDIFRKAAPGNEVTLFGLLDEPNPAIVVLAVDAIARVPKPPALRRLRAFVTTHPSVDVRAAALRTLGIAQDANAADVIVAALNDPAWEVRTQAAIAAGRARIHAAVPRLVTLMREPTWWVRLRAAQALARLDDTGVAQLQRYLDDKDIGRLVDFALSERHSR